MIGNIDPRHLVYDGMRRPHITQLSRTRLVVKSGTRHLACIPRYAYKEETVASFESNLEYRYSHKNSNRTADASPVDTPHGSVQKTITYCIYASSINTIDASMGPPVRCNVCQSV